MTGKKLRDELEEARKKKEMDEKREQEELNDKIRQQRALNTVHKKVIKVFDPTEVRYDYSHVIISSMSDQVPYNDNLHHYGVGSVDGPKYQSTDITHRTIKYSALTIDKNLVNCTSIFFL